jgi:hypothetical protein
VTETLFKSGSGPRRAIVTGGDAAYYPLIYELLTSIRRFIVVLDCGLQPDQIVSLRRAFAAEVRTAQWHYALPPGRTRGRDHLKALIARPFLPDYAPRADLIAWVDADAWVQDFAALDMMFEAAGRGHLAIVSQNSRYSARTISLRWLGFGLAEVRSILYKNARKAGVRERDARIMADRGTLNCGVFALARTAPHWEAWRKRQAQVIKKARLFSSDQFTLGMTIYVDGLPVTLMPETCNYTPPLWRCSDDGCELVEYYPPYNRLGVVHLAGLEEMRRDLNVVTDIECVSGGTIRKSLRQPAWQIPAKKSTISSR